MITRYIGYALMLWPYLAGITRGADDSTLLIHSSGVKGTGFKYVWSLQESRLAALPHCDPSASEVPVSPHQAIRAATEFIRTQFPASTELRTTSCTLLTRGVANDRVARDLWMYDVWFTPEPWPAQSEEGLLTVHVLMDGKVVVPIKEPSE